MSVSQMSIRARSAVGRAAVRVPGALASGRSAASFVQQHPARAFAAEADVPSGAAAGSKLPPLQAREPMKVEYFVSVDKHYKGATSSAPGKRAPSPVQALYEDDPKYNMMRELTGYNEFINSEIVFDHKRPAVPNVWGKQYFRDDKGEATMPERFKGMNMDLDKFGKFMEKADHYFFAKNVHPRLHVYMPFEQPAASSVDGFFASEADEAAEIAKQKRLRAAFEEVVARDDARIAAHEAAQAAGDADIDVSRVSDRVGAATAESQADMESYSTMLTAQQRRAEFWTKFASMLSYTDAMFDQTVRCTRAVGRVSSFNSLVVMGNRNGVFTYGRGKGPNAEFATRRAIYKCRRNVMFVPMHEHRTPFQTVIGKWKCTRLLLKQQPRGFGLRAAPTFFSMLEAVGFEDATVKRIGSSNMWSCVRAFMECLRQQRSYRDIALSRGANVEVLMNPFFKTPPAPTREELAEIEKDASESFAAAVKDVVASRDLLQTPQYALLEPYFAPGVEARHKAAMDSVFDAKNVPSSMRIYPSFVEHMDVMALGARVDEANFNVPVPADIIDQILPISTDYGYLDKSDQDVAASANLDPEVVAMVGKIRARARVQLAASAFDTKPTVVLPGEDAFGHPLAEGAAPALGRVVSPLTAKAQAALAAAAVANATATPANPIPIEAGRVISSAAATKLAAANAARVAVQAPAQIVVNPATGQSFATTLDVETASKTQPELGSAAFAAGLPEFVATVKGVQASVAEAAKAGAVKASADVASARAALLKAAAGAIAGKKL